MNKKNFTFALLSILLTACGSGSSSDSEQSKENTTLSLINNAIYMAVRYNENNWEQIEDNQTVSIQLPKQTDVVSIIYSCGYGENSEYDRSITEIMKFDQRHLKYLINNSGDVSVPVCVNYPDYSSSTVINEKEINLPQGYTFIDIAVNGRNEFLIPINNELSNGGSGSSYEYRAYNGFNYLDTSKSKIVFSRYDEDINGVLLSALIKDSSETYFIYESQIDVSSSEEISILSSELSETRAFTFYDTSTFLTLNNADTIISQYGSSYNYNDGFSTISRYDGNSILNLCSTSICWEPTKKSENPRYSYSWRYSSNTCSEFDSKCSLHPVYQPHSGYAVIFSDVLDENILKNPIEPEIEIIKINVNSSSFSDDFKFHAYKENNSIIPVLGLVMSAFLESSDNLHSMLRYSVFLDKIDHNSISMSIPSIDDLPGFSEATQFNSLVTSNYLDFNFIQSKPSSDIDYSLAMRPLNIVGLQFANEFFIYPSSTIFCSRLVDQDGGSCP